MKHIFSLIFIAFAITAHAQQQAEIEVSYTEYQPNMRNYQKDGTSHQYILLVSGDDSKFFSPRTEYIDSLNSTQRVNLNIKKCHVPHIWAVR